MIDARLLSLAGCSALLCLLTGCASSGPVPPTDKYLVSVQSAQFYKYGPAQAFGADFNLTQGQKVTMLERQFGYSRVMLEDGETSGYMATEDLKPAPPEPPPKPAPARKISSGSGRMYSGKPKRSNVQPTPIDPLFDVNDVPLPLPDDEPVSEPTNEPSSTPEPDFRY